MKDDSVEQLRAELVNLLQRQVEALKLETYVSLTHAELREFYKRQERIRDLKASFGPPSLTLPTTIIEITDLNEAIVGAALQNGETRLLHGLDKKLTTLDAPKQIMGGCIQLR